MAMMKTTTLMLALVAGASLASAQEYPAGCAPTVPCPLARDDQRDFGHHGRVVRTWDPYLAQWRVEQPGRVWDPNLAQYRYESRDQVWDPYLARYRPRDARRDPAPAFDRQADGRHRHPGQQGWCSARH